jgi:hypothetical protein
LFKGFARVFIQPIVKALKHFHVSDAAIGAGSAFCERILRGGSGFAFWVFTGGDIQRLHNGQPFWLGAACGSTCGGFSHARFKA